MEVLQETPWHHIQGPHQTPKAIRARDQIIRACKDHIRGNSTRRKEERQTKEEMGGQYQGVDRIGAHE